MKAHDLARILLDGPNHPVHVAYPSGDHWRTVLAPEVTKAEVGQVAYTDYHRTDKLLDEDDAQDDAREVVVLD